MSPVTVLYSLDPMVELTWCRSGTGVRVTGGESGAAALVVGSVALEISPLVRQKMMVAFVFILILEKHW